MSETKSNQSAPPNLAVDLLGDLQNRLEALKNWQTQSEQQAERLREQSRAIEDERGALDTRQKQIDTAWDQIAGEKQTLADERAQVKARLVELDAARHDLDQDRATLEKLRASFETERAEMEDLLKSEQDDLAARRSQLEEEAKASALVLKKDRDTLGNERKAVEARQTELDAAFAKLREDESALTSRQEAFQSRITQIEAEHAQIAEQRQELEGVRAKLEKQLNDLDHRNEQLAARAAELEALRHEVDAEIAGFTEREKAVVEAEKHLAAEKLELKKNREQLHRVQIEQELRGDSLNAQEASLNKAREALVQRASEASSLGDEQGDLSSALTEARAKLDEERHRIQKAESQLKEVRGRFDQREKEANELREQLDHRTAELKKLSSQVESLRASAQQSEHERKLAISERDAALSRKAPADDFDADSDATMILPVAGLVAGNAGKPAPAASDEELEHLLGELTEREQQLEALRGQLKQRDRELEQGRIRIAELTDQLSDLREQVAKTSDAGERLAALELELDERNRKADDLASDLDARVSEIKLLRERIDQLADGSIASEGDGEIASDLEAFDRRSAQLAEQAAQIAADRDRIQQRKEQLKQADEVIRKRREKLRTYISAMRERGQFHEDGEDGPVPTGSGAHLIPVAAALSPSDAAKLAGIDRDRKQLAEVKQFLQQSEAAMVKRWATYETAWVIGVVFTAVLMMAVVSYLAGNQLAVPEYRATMAMQVTPTASGADLPAGAWTTGYRRTLLDTPVMEEVLKQLEQRGIRIASTPATLADHFRTTLSVEGDPSRVVISYAGQDADRLGLVLDAFSNGLQRWHLLEDNKAGRLNTATVLQSAAPESKPVKDQRLQYASIVFGSLVGLALLLFFPIRMMKARSQRVLNDEHMPKLELSTLDKPETWSPVAAVATKKHKDHEDDGMGSPDDTISNYR